MFEVIISTISTGRVQRKTFDNYEKASECAKHFDEVRTPTEKRIYRVELVRRDAPAVQPIPMPSAA